MWKKHLFRDLQMGRIRKNSHGRLLRWSQSDGEKLLRKKIFAATVLFKSCTLVRVEDDNWWKMKKAAMKVANTSFTRPNLIRQICISYLVLNAPEFIACCSTLPKIRIICWNYFRGWRLLNSRMETFELKPLGGKSKNQNFNPILRRRIEFYAEV